MINRIYMAFGDISGIFAVPHTPSPIQVALPWEYANWDNNMLRFHHI